MKIKAYIELTRWKEHVLYVIPLTLLGVILGSTESGVGIGWDVVYILLANISANTFAFMINDIEDAEDDAKDKKKMMRNPISAGKLSREESIQAAKIVLVVSATLFALSGLLPFVTGIFILILSHLYSWRSIRLKSLPLVDIISHVLMLGTLLTYSGFTLYSSNVTEIWLVGMSVAFFSTYGQLYNQHRDYANDKLAGLKNTASLLSENVLQRLMYLSVAAGVFTFFYAAYSGLFPGWLILPALLGLIASKFIKPQSVMGIKATGKIEQMQLQSLVPFNIAIISWFLYKIISQL